jgi:predicted NUDIX family phosphoesterase
MDESVLVVPAEDLFANGEWLGFSPDLGPFYRLLERPQSLEFRPRSEVETDPSVKQLIPYAVLRRGDSIFAYQRGKSGGEDRLHSRWSIGVGGHICEEDGDSIQTAYQTGFQRELDEEVRIEGAFTHRVVGLIYDPRTPVGTVHVGVVHVVDVQGDVQSNDPSLQEAGFLSLAEIQALSERMESWSQFVIEPLTAGSL